MNADLIAFAQWLVNQGAGVAIALLVLWRLDKRLVALNEAVAELTAAQSALLSWLARHDAAATSPK